MIYSRKRSEFAPQCAGCVQGSELWLQSVPPQSLAGRWQLFFHLHRNPMFQIPIEDTDVIKENLDMFIG